MKLTPDVNINFSLSLMFMTNKPAFVYGETFQPSLMFLC